MRCWSWPLAQAAGGWDDAPAVSAPQAGLCPPHLERPQVLASDPPRPALGWHGPPPAPAGSPQRLCFTGTGFVPALQGWTRGVSHPWFHGPLCPPPNTCWTSTGGADRGRREGAAGRPAASAAARSLSCLCAAVSDWVVDPSVFTAWQGNNAGKVASRQTVPCRVVQPGRERPVGVSCERHRPSPCPRQTSLIERSTAFSPTGNTAPSSRVNLFQAGRGLCPARDAGRVPSLPPSEAQSFVPQSCNLRPAGPWVSTGRHAPQGNPDLGEPHLESPGRPLAGWYSRARRGPPATPGDVTSHPKGVTGPAEVTQFAHVTRGLVTALPASSSTELLEGERASPVSPARGGPGPPPPAATDSCH